MPGSLSPYALVASIVLATTAAFGDPNDLALSRLSFFNAGTDTAPNYVFAGGCGTADANYAQCFPDNQLFVNLVNQLGLALAPPLLAPAGTLGYNGLYFAYEGTVTGIDAPAEYWHRGTLGTVTGNVGTGTAASRDRVANALYASHFHVRKAFPLGFELGLHATYLHESSLTALGLDVRWALFEGFRHGALGYLPDFSVRGAVNTLVGNQQLYLTVVSLDAMLSKQLTVAGMATVTPYIAGQGMLILGDSLVIDATPTRSSYQECPRRQTVFSTDANGNARSDIVCEGGTGQPPVGVNDSRNEMVFMQTRLLRTRAIGGLRFRYSYLTITAEFSYDVLPTHWLNGNDANGHDPGFGQGRPDNANGGARGNVTLDDTRQYQVSFGVGLTF